MASAQASCAGAGWLPAIQLSLGTSATGLGIAHCRAPPWQCSVEVAVFGKYVLVWKHMEAAKTCTLSDCGQSHVLIFGDLE